MLEGVCRDSDLILHALLIRNLVIACASAYFAVLIVIQVAFSNRVAFVFHTWYNELLFNCFYTL